jgi:hypothetical protein
MTAMPPSSEPAPADVHELVRRGRDALAARRYEEAADLFDRALAAAPDDAEVQGLAVTAQFWRRLAREGDGLGLPPASTPRLGPMPGGAAGPRGSPPSAAPPARPAGKPPRKPRGSR